MNRNDSCFCNYIADYLESREPMPESQLSLYDKLFYITRDRSLRPVLFPSLRGVLFTSLRFPKNQRKRCANVTAARQ